MAGLGGAVVQGGAFNLWQRIWLGSRRTGTFRPLLLGQTNSILATSVLGAHIHTGEGEPVTKLGRRTISIGETAHSPTPVDQVSGIPGKLARWTGTLGHMVLGDANSLGPTGDLVAS